MIIVSGLARCGTSLTMQMLHACGLNCAGEFPAFEPPETNTLISPLRAEWMERFDAVKVIDPHRANFPKVEASVLWLDRDPAQQARSQLKFIHMATSLTIPSGQVGGMAKSLRRERPIALSQFAGMPVLILRFEEAVRAPDRFAEKIAEFLKPRWNLRIDAMVKCLRARRNYGMCEPSLDIEMALCEQRA